MYTDNESRVYNIIVMRKYIQTVTDLPATTGVAI